MVQGNVAPKMNSGIFSVMFNLATLGRTERGLRCCNGRRRKRRTRLPASHAEAAGFASTRM